MSHTLDHHLHTLLNVGIKEYGRKQTFAAEEKVELPSHISLRDDLMEEPVLLSHLSFWKVLCLSSLPVVVVQQSQEGGERGLGEQRTLIHKLEQPDRQNFVSASERLLDRCSQKNKRLRNIKQTTQWVRCTAYTFPGMTYTEHFQQTGTKDSPFNLNTGMKTFLYFSSSSMTGKERVIKGSYGGHPLRAGGEVPLQTGLRVRNQGLTVDDEFSRRGPVDIQLIE